MKKIVIALMLVMCVILLAGCGNNPQDRLLDKEYYIEYQSDLDSKKVIENTITFEKDGLVQTKSTQLTTAEDVGTYDLGNELINDKYYILKANVEGLNCSDEFLFEPEEMILYVYDEENGNYKTWDSCIHKLLEK